MPRPTVIKASKASAIALAACLGAAGLTACGKEDTSSQPSSSKLTVLPADSTATSTTSKTPSVTLSPSESSESPTAEPSSESNDSSASGERAMTLEDAQRIAIAEAEKRLPLADSDEQWIADTNRGDYQYDPDSDLAEVGVRMTKSRFRYQSAFFHKGVFQGFAGSDDILNNPIISGVKPSSDGVIIYFVDSEEWSKSGDPIAFQGDYAKPVRYYWAGDKVAKEGEVPR